MAVNIRTLRRALRHWAPARAARRLRALPRGLEFPLRAAPVPPGVEPPARRPATGVHYDTGWARTWPATQARRVLRAVVMAPVVEVLATPEIRGTDRLGNLEGPVVFAANHRSHADTPLITCAIPARFRDRLVVAAAADYFFRNRLTSAVSALVIGAVPVERTRPSPRSARVLSGLLADGWNVVIFPEGGRSPDGWNQPFKAGAAYLAVRAGVPLVPVHLEGTDRVMGKGRSLPRRSHTRVIFGSPIVPAPDDDPRELTVRLEREVAALADEGTTDWWTARRRYHRGETPPLTGPDAPAWRRAWSLPRRRRPRSPGWPRI